MFDQQLADIVAQTQPHIVQVQSAGRGAGSGIVWNEHGLIMTNHHVIANTSDIQITYTDQHITPAMVVASDPVLDLALLEVPNPPQAAAIIGDSTKIRVGEIVLAIGHPWGIRNHTTLGIISGTGAIQTSWRKGSTEYIRSDVRLAPGNSGGPLLNTRGHVIGINSMIFGGDLSIAIPAHIAEQFVLVSLQGPELGVTLQAVEVRSSKQADQAALMVTAIQPHSLAAQAGLLIGDILLDIANTPINEVHTLRWAMYHHQKSGPLALRVQRGTQTTEVNLALN